MSSSSDVGGRVILVTGAARGIGRDVVVAASAAGAHVVSCDLDGAVRDLPGLAVVIDAADPAGMQHLVEQAVERFGRLDAVVANAGIAVPTPPDLPLAEVVEAFDAQWHAIARAAYVTGRASLTALRRAARERDRPSDLILVSTDHVVPRPGSSPKVGWLDGYDAAKWALEGLRRNWAATQRRSDDFPGVRVNTIGMGETDTPMLRGFLAGRGAAQADIDRMAQGWMTGPDVAEVFLWLLADDDPDRTDTAIGLWPGHERRLDNRLPPLFPTDGN
jgi:NAD(P)-dependent dehydrogenase (short-subunit alcohol dehydrogenase family)